MHHLRLASAAQLLINEFSKCWGCFLELQGEAEAWLGLGNIIPQHPPQRTSHAPIQRPHVASWADPPCGPLGPCKVEECSWGMEPAGPAWAPFGWIWPSDHGGQGRDILLAGHFSFYTTGTFLSTPLPPPPPPELASQANPQCSVSSQ